MIVDFHTHIFPDKVAAKAIPKLSSVIHLEPSMNGTIDGLKASMEKSGVDISIVLPIVTNPHQFDSILRFAVHINETCSQDFGPGLVSFGGLHPMSENYKEQLRLLQKGRHQGYQTASKLSGTPL